MKKYIFRNITFVGSYAYSLLAQKIKKANSAKEAFKGSTLTYVIQWPMFIRPLATDFMVILAAVCIHCRIPHPIKCNLDVKATGWTV